MPFPHGTFRRPGRHVTHTTVAGIDNNGIEGRNTFLPSCASRKAKKPSRKGSADLGRPHHGDRAAAGLLLTWLHRLVAQVFEIVGEIIDLSRSPALAHVNAAVELGQLR